MKTNRTELLKILEVVRPGLAAKEIIEQSASFIFLDGLIATCNDRVCVTHPAVLGVVGSVQAEELYSLLKRMKKDEVELTADDKEIRLKCGRVEAGITLEKVISKMILQTIEEVTKAKKVWKELPPLFEQAISFCASVTSQDMTRPELTAIHFMGDHAEAADNFRLIRHKLGGKIDETLLPAAVMQELFSLPIKYALDKGWAHFADKDEAVFSCRTPEDKKYPDLDALIGIEGDKVEFPKGLTNSLERVLVFAGKGFEAALFRATITLADGVLKIEGRNSVGWLREQLTCPYEGKPVVFEVNPQLLIDILKRLRQAQVTPKMLKFIGEDFIYCCAASVPETAEK